MAEVRRRRLVGGWFEVCRGLALALVFVVVAVEPVFAASVRIDKPRRISLASPFSGLCAQGDPNFTPGVAVETSVAVDPRDARRILVSWIQDGHASDLVMASRDGGRSFARIFVPGLSACTGGSPQIVSDPGVAFSADGRVAYFSGAPFNVLSENPFTPAVGMAASRSFDGGFSWSTPLMVQPVSNDFWDKPELSVDPRRPRVAYYAFDKRLAPGYTSGHSLLSTTTNRGRTWSAPQRLYDPHTSDSWPGTSTILVNRDGSLLDIFVLSSQGGVGPSRIMAIRSVNGGHTWGEPIAIGRSSGLVNDPVTQNILETNTALPSQTVAPNGDVYVVWTKPGERNASSKIAIARSSDEGRHWSRGSLAVRGQAALPSIAVAGDGTVGLLHYVIAPKSQAGNWPARLALATSRDRARRWSRRHVAGPFNLLTADGENYRGCCFVGDYIGLATMPHGFAGAFSMAKPIARNAIDVYFIRATTSRRGG